MNIIGEKIYLRAIELNDKKVLLEIINNPEIERNLGGWSLPISELNQEEWIRSLKPQEKILRCMIVLKNDNIPIGTAILSEIDYKNGTAEIHIKLHPDTHSKGYGFETIELLVGYAFKELRLNCIYASINSYNINSQKLFEKIGFQKEGILRQRIFKQGSYTDIFSYSILKGDYIGNR